MSSIIIGLICQAHASKRPTLSPEACELILQTGMENMSVLLEELGVKGKAIYLPSSMREDHAQALIPLLYGRKNERVRGKMPGRLIVRYGTNADDMAIAVATPGSINISKLNSKPGPTASEIESAGSYVLSGLLDLAISVSATIEEAQITVKNTRNEAARKHMVLPLPGQPGRIRPRGDLRRGIRQAGKDN